MNSNNQEDKVSVIVPTYNRFKYLLNNINSISKQTYKNIEIIVINDCSTQKEYYEHDWSQYPNLTIIHLKENSRQKFGYGYACIGYVRNQGIKIATGKYIGFCDDDDMWLPWKLERQIKLMKETNCKMSSTEGLIGEGPFDANKNYEIYNRMYYPEIMRIFNMKNKIHLIQNGFPKIWDLDFLKVHNCCVACSVVIEKSVLEKINYFNEHLIGGKEDYDCWLRALEHTNTAYLDYPCFYYDNGHGDGQEWRPT